MINHWKWYTKTRSDYSHPDAGGQHHYEPPLKALVAPCKVLKHDYREDSPPSKVAGADMSRDNDRLVFHGSACKESFNCSESISMNFAYTALIDSRKEDVEKALKCRIIIHERKCTKGQGLTVQVRAYSLTQFFGIVDQ